jgi:hypothetical protein
MVVFVAEGLACTWSTTSTFGPGAGVGAVGGGALAVAGAGGPHPPASA